MKLIAFQIFSLMSWLQHRVYTTIIQDSSVIWIILGQEYPPTQVRRPLNSLPQSVCHIISLRKNESPIFWPTKSDLAYLFYHWYYLRFYLLSLLLPIRELKIETFSGRRQLQPDVTSSFVGYCACSCSPLCRRGPVGDVKLVCLALWRKREYLTFISIRFVAFSNQHFADYRS